ncbi:MAG: OmpA family protein [Pseudomonadota bacterium]
MSARPNMSAAGARYASYNELRRMLVHRRAPMTQRLPPWSLTFADLMMLLLTFFVMLSSLSEIDKEKYRVLSVSLATQLQGRASTQALQPAPIPLPPAKMTEQTYMRWAQEALRSELEEHKVEIERREGQLVLRIGEQVAFASASADINQNFLPTLSKIAQVVAKAGGRIIVAGHTDDVPINSLRFPSNWELSGARAAAVVRALSLHGPVNVQRFVVEAYADTMPLTANDTVAHRAHNRRVEIRVVAVPPTESAEGALTPSADGVSVNDYATN